MTPQRFAEAAGLDPRAVSRETFARLEAYDAALLAAAGRHNLIARSTLAERWTRHFADSAQLLPLIPSGAKTLVDLGSGAGFPGLVLAALRPGLAVALVESTRKKAAFLDEAARAMRLENVSVIPERVESLTLSPPDVITARALAPLAKLLGYVQDIVGEKTLCLFLKGQDVEGELTEAAKSWHMEVERTPSRTSPGSVILAIRGIAPRRVRP